MASALNKLVGKIAIEGSKLLYPSKKKKVAQITIEGRENIVWVNEDVGRQMFCFRQYEPRESAFLSRIIKNADICFDVGANTGHFTNLMAAKATDGEVHSFEPLLLNWHLLNVSVAINKFKNVTINNTALGERVGEVNFSSSSDSAYSSLKSTGRQFEDENIQVNMDTIDNYVNKKKLPRVDVMKVDVEGAEGLVIVGAKELLADAALRPRVVLLELFDPNHKAYNTSVSEIVSGMMHFGYSPLVFTGPNRLEKFEAKHYNRFFNVLFIQNPNDYLQGS